MRIIPVIDLKDRIVVRGVGGRREQYKPVVSNLTSSCDPIDVAEAFRDRFGFDEIYLADLDAIAGAPPALKLYGQLGRRGFRLWVDAGIHVAVDAEPLADCDHLSIVAGLETLAEPEELGRLYDRHGERIIFSLDLKQGLPLGGSFGWPYFPVPIALRAIEFGARRLLLLDLARVGEGGGTGTEELCAQVVREHPEVEVCAGGGVRGPQDLERLRECGVSAVLVASALHDGRLKPEEVRSWGKPGSSQGRHS